VVTTIHGFSSQRIVPVYRAYDDIGHYVAISDADRHPDLTYAVTIHHGIAVDDFTFGAGDGGYLLFLGRIHPDKGTAEAIGVARRAGVPIVIAGVIQDEKYFERNVAPQVDGNRVTYVGPVGPEERNRLLGGAMALMHLIAFDEPFGLSVVESLAAGTPVIARPRGSMPELIRPGVTGYLVDDQDAAVEAVHAIGALSRQDCRADAVARFTADRMVGEYEALFASIVEGKG
jgi:glycosyltransferase involved in cell wall biosynthesis